MTIFNYFLKFLNFLHINCALIHFEDYKRNLFSIFKYFFDILFNHNIIPLNSLIININFFL